MLSYKDKLRLPYTEAVLSETLRIGNISPTGIPHSIERDFVVQGKVSTEIVHSWLALVKI